MLSIKYLVLSILSTQLVLGQDNYYISHNDDDFDYHYSQPYQTRYDYPGRFLENTYPTYAKPADEGMVYEEDTTIFKPMTLKQQCFGLGNMCTEDASCCFPLTCKILPRYEIPLGTCEDGTLRYPRPEEEAQVGPRFIIFRPRLQVPQKTEAYVRPRRPAPPRLVPVPQRQTRRVRAVND